MYKMITSRLCELCRLQTSSTKNVFPSSVILCDVYGNKSNSMQLLVILHDAVNPALCKFSLTRLARVVLATTGVSINASIRKQDQE